MATEDDYQNAVRKITEQAEQIKALQGDAESWRTLKSDSAYGPARELIRQIDGGSYQPPSANKQQTQASSDNGDEEPKWFREKYAPKLTAWEKQQEADRKLRVTEAIKKIDADEAAFREKYGHIPDEFFGPKGKINDFMARHGIDDFSVGAQAVIPLDLLTQKPKAARPKAPLGGSAPPSRDDDDDPQSEGAATNRAKERFMAQFGG